MRNCTLQIAWLPLLPTLMSFSAGPQPLVAETQERSLSQTELPAAGVVALAVLE